MLMVLPSALTSDLLPAPENLTGDPEHCIDFQKPCLKAMRYWSNSEVSAGVGNCPQHLKILHGDIILGSVLPSAHSHLIQLQKASATFTAWDAFVLRQTSNVS